MVQDHNVNGGTLDIAFCADRTQGDRVDPDDGSSKPPTVVAQN